MQDSNNRINKNMFWAIGIPTAGIILFIYTAGLLTLYKDIKLKEVIFIVLPLGIAAGYTFIEKLIDYKENRNERRKRLLLLILIPALLLAGMWAGVFTTDSSNKNHSDEIALDKQTLSTIKKFADSTIPKLDSAAKKLDSLNNLSAALLINQQQRDSLADIRELDRLVSMMNRFRKTYYSKFYFKLSTNPNTWSSMADETIDLAIKDLQSQYDNKFLLLNKPLLDKWKNFEDLLNYIQLKLVEGFENKEEQIGNLSTLITEKYECFYNFIEQYFLSDLTPVFLTKEQTYHRIRTNNTIRINFPCFFTNPQINF